MKVLIAGAGLAGLHAAWRLRKKGHEVVVFEAKDRVGGRTWSQKLDNGQVVERGAEFTFPTEFPIRQLAAELGVPLVGHGVRYGRRTVNGRYVDAHELADTVDLLARTVRLMTERGDREASLRDAFHEAVGADFALNPVYRRWATSAAANPEEVSARAMIHHETSGHHVYIEDGARFLEGNQSLALTLAARLSDNVRLESPIDSVEQAERGVQFTLRDGTRIEGDAAIIAVPLPILRRLHLGFALPSTMQEALDHKLMGTAAKLSIPVSSVETELALQNSDGFWWSWQSMGADGEQRIPAVTSFAGSSSTLSALNTHSGSADWVRQIQTMRPQMEQIGAHLMTDWTNDEWTMGSYSAPGLHWSENDDAAFDQLAGRVALAGEHTGSAQSMSGAVASGARAAALMRRLS